MLTSRDKRILKFMEETNLGLTIQQAGKMFFPKNQFSYDYARVRMKKLRDMGQVKFYKNHVTDEYIYYFDKRPTFHDNCLMNVYANLVYHNANILHFKKEQPFMDGKVRADAFMAYQVGDTTKIAIVEVDVGNQTHIEKYEQLYEAGELQEKYGDFPLLLVLHSTDRTMDSSRFTVINFDIKCSGFAEKVLAT